MNELERIVDRTRADVARRRVVVPISELERAADVRRAAGVDPGRLPAAPGAPRRF